MTPEDFDALFNGFAQTVVRLETLPEYRVGGAEAARLAAFQQGRPRPLRSVRTDPWLARIATSTVQAGKRWTRVRVVDDPLTAYERYQLASHLEAQACGEEVLIAARSAIPAVEAARDPDSSDFWLFDHGLPTGRAAVMSYDETGRWLGATLVTDPGELDVLAERVDRVQRVAVPLNEFLVVEFEAERHG